MHLVQSALYLVFSIIYFTGGVKVVSNVTQHDFLIVSLTGKTVEQFNTDLLEFQQLIANLAKAFCNASGLQNYGEINSSTIEINNVMQCPTEWPDSSNCISVNLSVPINYSGAYELSSRHLRTMWAAHSPSQLSELGLQDFEIPSDSTILILWLSITGVLIILFLCILVLVVKTQFIENYIRRRRDILGSSNRSWLAQHHEKQLVPPFFYPDLPVTKLKEVQSQYDVERNRGQDAFGIENPGYNPDTVTPNKGEKRISQTSTIMDDFDSDDDTIYPPSPLPIPMQKRNVRRNPGSPEELETAF